MAKSAQPLGFDLGDLEAATNNPALPIARPAAPTPTGRPRSLASDAQPVSVRLDGAQRQWLQQEAARRTLDSGERHDMSRVVRELIDQARGAS